MEHTKKTLYGAAVAAAMALTLAACGGGGGSSSPLPSSGGGSGTTNSPQMGQAQMRILIPAATKSSTAKPQYVSSSTQSLTVSQNGKQIGEADLTASSPSCTTGTGGSRTCTASFSAPVGTNEIFQVTMWDQPGGKGNKLSTGNVTVTIQAGSVAQVPVTLDGVPASASLVLGTGTLPVGNAGSTSVIVVAKDSGGNVIVGPGGYSNPFTLSIANDKYATLTLSEKTVSSPGQAVTLSYNGGSNVGSTITASATGLTPATASFNATGVSMAFSQYVDTANNFFLDPYAAAGSPKDGTGEIVGYWDATSCCTTSYDVIAVASPTQGVTKIFTGDVADPYNTPAPGSLTVPGVTVIHGMSAGVDPDPIDNYDAAAVDANGVMYYDADFQSNSAPNCVGHTISSGILGALNPATQTVSEKILKGYAGAIHADTNGNVWWIESAGDCNGVSLLGSDSYAIGKMTPSGTVTETPFSAAGLSSIGYPESMSITPDGSTMFIADESNSQIAKLSTATLGSPTLLPLTGSATPYTIAAGDDGTALWYSDTETEDEYFYGFVPGSKSFTTANLVEKPFPVPYLYSYASTYADGSFWIAGCDYGNMGRISGASTGTPVPQYFQMPYVDGDYSEWDGIGAGGGYVWATDYDYYNIAAIQYGAPGSGTMSFAARRVGPPMMSHFTHQEPVRRRSIFRKARAAHVRHK